MADNEICVGRNRYRIIPDSTTNPSTVMPSAPVVDMSVTESKLTRLVDIEGGGDIAGGYRSITLILLAHESLYEIDLGINARQFTIRCDQSVTIKFNNVTSDNIFINSSEFPFEVSGLNLNESVRSIFVTTGDNQTTIKILAFGMVQ